MLMSRVLRLTWRSSTALPKALSPSKEPIEKDSSQGLTVSRGLTSTSTHQKPIIADVKTGTEKGVVDVIEGSVNLKTVEVVFQDKSRSLFPHVWLRENCQCPNCFNHSAIARLFLSEELDLNIKPTDIQLKDGGMHVTWKDGHISSFTGQWLHQRSFNEEARAKHRPRFSLPMVYWGSDFKVPVMDFQAVMTDDKALLEWLVMFEKYGVGLLKDSPAKVGPMREFLEKLGFMRPTHYGLTGIEVIVSSTPNNLAITGTRLGLHTDMPYLDFSPGTIWLHCIRQHEGKGGDNDISDGFHAAHILREKEPALFDVLTKTPVYFQDKGYESYDFDKITKVPTIVLDEGGSLQRLHINSQTRDSIMDLDSEGVLQFYKALKAFHNILTDIKINYKTQPGDILAMDNIRVLHGRTEFDSTKAIHPRHLDNAYIDWSELRSKRRVLQDKLGIELN